MLRVGSLLLIAASLSPCQNIVPAQAEQESRHLLPVIADFHVDPPRICVAERIAERLARNVVNLVADERFSGFPFHLYTKLGTILTGSIRSEPISQCADRTGKVVNGRCARTQPLHRIPPLGDRLSGLLDDRLQRLPRFFRENLAPRLEVDRVSIFEEIVGISPALQAALSRVVKVAATDSTVLVTGDPIEQQRALVPREWLYGNGRAQSPERNQGYFPNIQGVGRGALNGGRLPLVPRRSPLFARS